MFLNQNVLNNESWTLGKQDFKCIEVLFFFLLCVFKSIFLAFKMSLVTELDADWSPFPVRYVRSFSTSNLFLKVILTT